MYTYILENLYKYVQFRQMSVIISIVSDLERGLSSALSLTWDKSLRTSARLRSSSVLQFWLHRPLITCVMVPIEDCSNTVISKARRWQTCLRFLAIVQSFAVIIFVIDAVVWHLLFIASNANLVKLETNICLSQSPGDKHYNILAMWPKSCVGCSAEPSRHSKGK